MTTDEVPGTRAPRRGRIVAAAVAFAVFVPIMLVSWFVRSDRSPSDSAKVLFPTWEGDARPAALVGGMLTEHDGCLFLGGADGEELALWESGYSYANGSLLDADGHVVARLGDWISGGGGLLGERGAEQVIGTKIRAACVPSGPEPFVMIYDVARAALLPELVSLTEADATAKLQDLGLSVEVRDRASDELAPGTVIEQEPPAGTSMAPGGTVAIVVSSGPSGPVSVGELPKVGIAVSSKHGVALLDVEGKVLATLPGYEIAGNPGAPGLWLRSGGSYFRLDPAAGTLDPVSKSHAKARMYQEPRPDLPSPPGSTGGDWRFAFASPAGGDVLAQWSGECETPTAYWIDGQGTERIVTGEQSLADAPESFALGWAPDGDALVFLPRGVCGSGSSRPGIYRFAAPAEGRLIHPTGGWIGAAAEGWTVR
jgi:hypothetical protein